MKNKIQFLLFVLLVLSQAALAQRMNSYIEVKVVPDRPEWYYKTGDKARFSVTVTRSGMPVKAQEVRFAVGPEKMEPVSKGVLKLDGTKATVEGGTMKVPGFLRCEVVAVVDGKEYRGIGTAAYEPERITPTVEMPSDFQAFWDAGKKELAGIPMDVKMTLIPERCTETVNVYHVGIQNVKSSRIYGILCVPKAEGKYPAILQVPGAGVRLYTGDIAKAQKGFITFQIGIHGVPVNMGMEVYQDMASGALNGYPLFNLDNKESYYYRRVYLGCVRAVDFITSLPQYDGSNIGVMGGSQGGALSIVTAALDNRIKFLAAFYPALSDITGYLHGRAGGWPHAFTGNNLKLHNKKDKIETVGYYDVVNFARNLKVPGFYSWGFNDETCPPTSMYSSYNVISAPKEVFVVQETGHWTYPEQNERLDQWIMNKLAQKSDN